jgi:uncharacterized membrane protein
MVMALLALGLLLFLGAHSVRIFADDWRARQIARLGPRGWKLLYSLVSIAGFVLIVVGFGQAGEQEPLWHPPYFMPHITAALVLIAFILLAAARVPGNRIKPRVGHPMVLGVKVWAFAHLLANGQPRHLLLFGAFLLWSIVDFASARRRDRAAGVSYPAGSLKGDAIAVVAGVAAWVVFAFFLHRVLIGVAPLG